MIYLGVLAFGRERSVFKELKDARRGLNRAVEEPGGSVLMVASRFLVRLEARDMTPRRGLCRGDGDIELIK